MTHSSLTEPVEIALKSSEDSLREALAFASKTETPEVNIAISQLIFAVNQILTLSSKTNTRVYRF